MVQGRVRPMSGTGVAFPCKAFLAAGTLSAPGLGCGVGVGGLRFGFSVQVAGSRVQGAGCRVQGAGCRVQGAGCRVCLARPEIDEPCDRH